MAAEIKPSFLSKEDASNLKSFADRLNQCELALQTATWMRDEAKRNLENFLHRLQYPPKQ